MKAVILTAGEGTRLRPLTVNRPKGMIPVANKPILEYVVQALVDNKITDVVMVVGYRDDRIKDHFQDGTSFGINITYAHQSKQLGTAHALAHAEEYVDGPFLVLPGDNIIDGDSISSLLGEDQGDASLLISESKTPSKYGVVGMEGTKVKKIVEKPKITGDLTETGVPSIFSLALWDHHEVTISNLISTGIARLTPDVFPLIKELEGDERHKLTDVFLEMISRKKEITGVMTSNWSDAVYPWDLLNLNAQAIGWGSMTIAGKVEKGVHMKGHISIGEGTTIYANTYIVGPTVIGQGCEIGPNVCILPSTSIGSNVTIGPFTTIENSLIMDSCAIEAGSHISQSVLGPGTTFGSHFITQKCGTRVQVMEDYHVVENLGAIVGEDCKIGSNVVVDAGCIIGANSEVACLKEVMRNIPGGSTLV